VTPRKYLGVLLASLLPCLLASVSFAGTVTGTIRNGTTGKPAAGVDVILIQLQGNMEPVAQTKTDANGHYQLDHPALGSGAMLIRAVYRGVNYHEPATPGKATVDIEVFEPTDKASAFAVTGHAIVFQPNGSDMVVDEEYLISNKSQPPVAYYRSGGSFLFSIPTGAQLGEVSVVGPSGMPLTQSPVSVGKSQEGIDYPFRPGDSSVRLSYKLPYPGNQATLRFVSPYAVDRLAVFAPPPMQVSGNGFSPTGQQQGFNVYMRQSVAANTPSSVSVSGTGSVPQPAAAAAGNPGGDDSQNPAVNSRVDSSAQVPAASITPLPARLDSLRWYVVGGFAAIFALGLMYLWRQPKVALAGASQTAIVAAAAEAAQPGRPAHTPKPEDAPRASPGAARSAASLEREVRGSLDELKDTLFRLELRREAGTITEAEYVGERDRVQQILRDLVKG